MTGLFLLRLVLRDARCALLRVRGVVAFHEALMLSGR